MRSRDRADIEDVDERGQKGTRSYSQFKWMCGWYDSRQELANNTIHCANSIILPVVSISLSSLALFIRSQGLPWPQNQMHLHEIRSGLQLLDGVAETLNNIDCVNRNNHCYSHSSSRRSISCKNTFMKRPGRTWPSSSNLSSKPSLLL